MPAHGDNNNARMEEFLSLYNVEQRRIYIFIRSLLSSDQDADDVFQETCIALWRAFDQYEPGTNFGAWARQVARHRVLAHCKNAQKRRDHLSAEAIDALAEEYDRDADLYEARQAALDSCLNSLPSKDKQLLTRRYESGVSTVSLSAELGRPVATLYKSREGSAARS